MREIRFRGQDMESYKWVYGNLCNTCGDESGPMCIDCFVVDPATVGQFTGLRDANGVEIYEGDIVDTMALGMFEVIFDCGAFRIAHGCIKFTMIEGSYYEVVGNVHDAPELMK